MGLLLPLSPATEHIRPGVTLFRRRAPTDLIQDASVIIELAPPRHMATPWGKTMSAKITNCGDYGWISDEKGYRYDGTDPVSGKPWPKMPASFARLARDCAAEAGFKDFLPDACLVNVYDPGAKMGLHQDRDEEDFAQPIVSVSLGVAASFRFGGLKRSDPSQKIRLEDGDVLVFGGLARLCFHGIDSTYCEPHDRLGLQRINLTFRKARTNHPLIGQKRALGV